MSIATPLAYNVSMTRAQLTPQTAGHLNELAIVLDEMRRLNERAEELKWLILDTRENGTQTAVASIYCVRRQAVGQWIKTRSNTQQAAA